MRRRQSTTFPPSSPRKDPVRKWYAEPARVFDDLFFLGQTAFSVWGLRTNEGVILVDSIFDYSVEAEVIDGLRKLGIDPAEIRYVIISHAHGDHSGGAGILQQHGARIVMSATDWDLYEKSNDKIKAKRDLVATDGMAITLGGTTVRVYLTPGHTHGTISTVLPRARRRTAARRRPVGRNAVQLQGQPGRSARRALEDLRAIRGPFPRDGPRRWCGHPAVESHGLRRNDRQATCTCPHAAPVSLTRTVVGADAVQRYFRVAEECAIATREVGRKQ